MWLEFCADITVAYYVRHSYKHLLNFKNSNFGKILVSPDQTSAVFEGLCKVVKHVTNPGDCSSAERCILAYLFDLYSSCSLLKTKPQPTEPFHNAYPKIKQALYAQLTPVATTQYSCKREFMADVLANPKRGGKIEPSWGRQLNESAANRYSFVCNALIAVSQETDNDRLNNLSQMCAELTACCNSLSTEWLGALIALCGSSNEPFYQDILGKIDIQNLSIHNSLAVFTCILVGECTKLYSQSNGDRSPFCLRSLKHRIYCLKHICVK